MTSLRPAVVPPIGIVLNEHEARTCLRLAREARTYAVRFSDSVVTLAIPGKAGKYPDQVVQRRMPSAGLARAAAQRLPGICDSFDLDPVSALRVAEEYAQAARTFASRTRRRWRR